MLSCFLAEAFDLVLRHGRNSTLTMLKSEFPGLLPGAQSSVGQLFLDMSLYILGSDSTVDHMGAAFFSKLFPLTYRRLLGGGASSLSEECVRGVWKDSGVFGPYPKLIMTRLSRSLLATRVFLQALNLGIEVVNTTDHLRPSRDCSRALLRLWYCPHCQGMLGPPACRGFCQTVMQGCLGGAAEVQPHWRSYIDGLGKLTGGMRGEQDMEAVVLRLPSMIKLALKQAVNARSRLSVLVVYTH
ncbi:Glypican-3 [Ilyodon furcidens]|uniref:Glypican-3 n=1 Tax=Ilyodon furcidens TaxID=33524 RepID=A0ABV0U8Q8_9TELE